MRLMKKIGWGVAFALLPALMLLATLWGIANDAVPMVMLTFSPVGSGGLEDRFVQNVLISMAAIAVFLFVVMLVIALFLTISAFQAGFKD